MWSRKLEIRKVKLENGKEKILTLKKRRARHPTGQVQIFPSAMVRPPWTANALLRVKKLVFAGLHRVHSHVRLP
jgi:hypothetical protein